MTSRSGGRWKRKCREGAVRRSIRRRLRVDQAVRARGGCLGTGRRRRTWQAAKSRGELQASVDPRVSEWGNPAGVMPGHRVAEFIGCARRTRGTETSKYPEEEETTRDSPSSGERKGRSPNRGGVTGCSRCPCGVVGRIWRGLQVLRIAYLREPKRVGTRHRRG